MSGTDRPAMTSLAALAAVPVVLTAAISMPARADGELNVYNWSDYIGKNTIANFEKEFNVKVRYDMYDGLDPFALTNQAAYDPGNEYAVPYMRGTNGFTYNVAMMMRPDVIADCTNYIGYANGSLAATPLVDPAIAGDVAIYPDAETQKRMFPNVVRDGKCSA